MAQQTAVEWLFIQLYEKFEMKGDGMEMDKVLEQAKQMEKEQTEGICINVIENILNEFDEGKITSSKEIFEQYYKETYGNNQTK